MAWHSAFARLVAAGTGVDVAHAAGKRLGAARRLGALLALCLLGMLALLMAAPVRAQSVLDGFDPGANGVVTSLVVQPDGKVLVGGYFAQLGGQTRNRLARLNPEAAWMPTSILAPTVRYTPSHCSPTARCWSVANSPSSAVRRATAWRG